MSDNKPKTPKKITEGTFDVSAPLPFFPYGNYSNDLFASAPVYGFLDGDNYGQEWMARRDNRLAGEDLPNYINWWQLKVIRDEQRRICQTNTYAQSAIDAFKKYVVGTGFTYTVTPSHDNVSPELVSQVQMLVDLFCEHNRMAEIESEICYRLHCDGEVFLRMFPNYEDGLLRVRFIEPELVRPPQDDSFPDESFGIKCADHDIHEIVGYWVIEQPYFNLTPTLVDPREIIHIKMNVNSNSKRGLPTTYSCQANLRACADTLQALVTIAKARARFAAIRTIENAPPESIGTLGERSTNATITDPNTGQQTKLSHYGYGTILTVPSTIKWEFPSLALGSQDLIETLNANLRAIASRFGISETMLSADASNNNYASSLVAEAPAVKTFQRFGKMMASYLAERRTQPNRSLIWNQLVLAVKVGMLPDSIFKDITIHTQMPTVVTREMDKEAMVNKTYMEMGIKSPQTITAEIGLEYEKERKNFDMAQDLIKELDAQTKQEDPEAAEAQEEDTQADG
jgi:hypothetical protein